MGWKQFGMYSCVLAMVPLAYVYGVLAVLSGWWGLLALGMLLISPVAMMVLRACFEQPFGMRGFVNPYVMSWGFVAGDFVLLPFAAWFAGRGWGIGRVVAGAIVRRSWRSHWWSA